jgi:ADP-heptose:LPS heptosyltransferase
MRGPWYLKLQLKVIHLCRRSLVFFLRFAFRKYRLERPIALESISSVLIVPHHPIGDVLLCEPMWRILKARNPNIIIGVAASTSSIEIVARDPNVDKTYLFWGTNILRRIQAVQATRQAKWDVVLTTGGFFKPVRFALLTRYIAKRGITASMHESREERYHDIYSFCFKRPCFPYPQPIAEQFESLIEQTFDIHYNGNERVPRFKPSTEDMLEIHARLDTLRHQTGKNRTVQIHLEAKWRGMEWGIGNSLQLATEIVNAYPNTNILLTASPAFAKEYAEELRGAPEIAQYFPLHSVGTLAALESVVDLVIAPDTSAVHLAAVARTPVIGLYERLNEWLPYQTPCAVFTANPIDTHSKLPVSTIPIGPVLQASLSFLAHEDVSGSVTPKIHSIE